MKDCVSITRISKALISDMIFQFKHGFYFIYILISFIYLLILGQLSLAFAGIALPIIVYSDPSVLGLFFIGGILMLEKEQGIIQILSVTPLKTTEYLIAKLISLWLISLMAVFLITLLSGIENVNYLLLIFGVTLISFFFTLIGIMIATKSRHLNAFFVKMIPWMVLLVLPCVLLFIFPEVRYLGVYPSIAGLKLVYGAYNGISYFEFFLSTIVLIISDVLLFNKALLMFEKHMIYGGI